MCCSEDLPLELSDMQPVVVDMMATVPWVIRAHCNLHMRCGMGSIPVVLHDA